jgi:RES domain-containing protein
MKANPRQAHFLRILKENSSQWLKAWSGDCWRFQSVRFPSPDEILGGAGALNHGGRWNGIGAFPAVYGSEDDVTAVKESGAVAAYAGFPMREPRLLVAIELKLGGVLDLTDAAIRRKLGVTLKEIRLEDWRKIQDARSESLSQALGRAASDAGAEAVRVPSFAHKGGINVAFFPDNLRSGSAVSLWHRERIEKLRKQSPEK